MRTRPEHGQRRLPGAHSHGPTGGDIKLETVVASTDVVAADACAATLFDLSGEDIPSVAAADMGLGEIDLERVDVRATHA